MVEVDAEGEAEAEVTTEETAAMLVADLRTVDDLVTALVVEEVATDEKTASFEAALGFIAGREILAMVQVLPPSVVVMSVCVAPEEAPKVWEKVGSAAARTIFELT